MRRAPQIMVATLVLAALVTACGQPGDTPETLRLIAHDSFKEGVTDATFAAFTEASGITVEVIAAGDAGAMVNQAVLSKDNPLADVLFGVDDTFLSRAIDAGIFQAHEAEGTGSVDPDLLRDDDLVTPVDYGDVCINYDKERFPEGPPESLDQLRDPALASQLVVEHPATSSPGLAFILATIDVYGEEGWLDFWSDLDEGGVEVISSWNTAYYESFSRYGGDRSLVVSYASSPPSEVMFADPPTDTAPTGVITAGCYRQVEYAGILAGTDHPDAAGRLIDYMLSVEFQSQIPESWFVFPVNEQAPLPDVFAAHAVLPDDPTRFDADYIAANRDRWIDEWIEVMSEG